MHMKSIQLTAPSVSKIRNVKNEPRYDVDIRALSWTLHVPEAHELVERALYRGFFDIIDRTRLEVLRKETEIRWNKRIQTNYLIAKERQQRVTK